MREAGIGKRGVDRSVSASMLLGRQLAEQRLCMPFRYFLQPRRIRPVVRDIRSFETGELPSRHDVKSDAA